MSKSGAPDFRRAVRADERRNRRKFTRVSLDAHVEVLVPSTDKLFESRLKDLSENGVFVLTEDTRPIGTGIDIHITVRGAGCTVQAKGIIVHEVPTSEASDERPAGFGVMFTEVLGAGDQALRELIKKGQPVP